MSDIQVKIQEFEKKEMAQWDEYVKNQKQQNADFYKELKAGESERNEQYQKKLEQLEVKRELNEEETKLYNDITNYNKLVEKRDKDKEFVANILSKSNIEQDTDMDLSDDEYQKKKMEHVKEYTNDLKNATEDEKEQILANIATEALRMAKKTNPLAAAMISQLLGDI